MSQIDWSSWEPCPGRIYLVMFLSLDITVLLERISSMFPLPHIADMYSGAGLLENDVLLTTSRLVDEQQHLIGAEF